MIDLLFEMLFFALAVVASLAFLRPLRAALLAGQRNAAQLFHFSLLFKKFDQGGRI